MTSTRTGGVALVVGLALAGLGLAGAAFAQPAGRAYVLDTGARALVALELPSGKRAGSLALSGSPRYLLRSPDGSRLVVLDPGPGEDKDERGYKATGKSSATVVDAATLALVGRVELGAGIASGRSHFSPDGLRLTLLCPGYEAKNPAEALARELVTIDLAAGREAGRLALEPGAVPLGAERAGQWLSVIQGLPRPEKFPFPKSRLFVVDLAGPSLRSQHDLPGWSAAYTDGARFYLLDPGKPDKNPQKNRNGAVHVVTLGEGVLAGPIDAGRDPRGLLQDEAGGQVFVPSDGPPGATEGELRVLRGSELAATLKVAANPRLLKREGSVVFVVGEKAVTLVDPVALQVTSTIPLARGSDALVDDDDLPTELMASPDGRRAFVHYGLHHKVATLDIAAQKAMGSTKTGRGGKKFLGNMMGGLYGWAGMWAVGYSIWIRTAPSMLAVRPDGGFAYAINNQTKDVTVVDGATGKSVEMIGGAGYALELLKDGRLLFEVSGSELRLVDLERNTKAAEIQLADLRGLFFSPDRSVALAPAKGVVLLLDGTTGKELAWLRDFTSPDAVVFEEPAAAR